MQHREVPAFVGPVASQGESDVGSDACEAVDGVLVGVLGADRLALPKRERFSPDRNLLLRLADQVHLHAAPVLVVERSMLELLGLEIAAQFSVDAPEQVEVELGRDAGGVVVGRFDHGDVFLQVHTDQQAAADASRVETIVRDQPKVGRNDPCPCGSGKKYKKCCGRNA